LCTLLVTHAPHPLLQHIPTQVLEHIDQGLAADTPLAFGLHPNAEIGFRTEMSERLFRTILELSPQEQSTGEGTESPQTVAEAMLQVGCASACRDIHPR
jgi:hypothetical protein